MQGYNSGRTLSPHKYAATINGRRVQPADRSATPLHGRQGTIKPAVEASKHVTQYASNQSGF